MAQQNVRTEKGQGDQSQSLTRSDANSPARLFMAPADLFRMNPFALMGRMLEEIDRAIAIGPAAVENAGMAMWTPPVEVSRHDGDYEIRAELPGLKPEEVKVEVTGNTLVLEGDRKFEHEENQGGVYRTERHYGHFFRSIPLPEGADVDHAHARFDNGVLQVTVPVPQQQSDRKQIPIEAAQQK